MPRQNLKTLENSALRETDEELPPSRSIIFGTGVRHTNNANDRFAGGRLQGSPLSGI